MATTLSSPTTFVIVRHGETVWNSNGVQQGHLDSDLTPLGRNQAHALAAALLNRRFDFLYSSDLGRALQTAQIISTSLGLEVRTDERLRERNLGIMQGLTREEFGRRFPAEMAAFNSGNEEYVIPHGESVRQRREKSVAFFNEIASKNPGKNILIVSHSGILYGLFRHAVGLSSVSRRTFSLFNASINEFSITGGEWMLLRWGCTGHLTGISTADHW